MSIILVIYFLFMPPTQNPLQKVVPMLLLIVLMGGGAVALAKYGDKIAPGQDITKTPSSAGVLSSTLGTQKTGSTTPSAFATFCETAYPGTGTVNIPTLKDGEHICGNPAAPIVIVEYSDLECPFCKQFHPALQRVVAESNGQIAWVYRHYPIDSLHSRARKESEASECAYDQGGDSAFWKYIDKIYAVTSANNSLAPELLPVIASEIGLDRAKFEACLASGSTALRIENDIKLGGANGPIGTPNSHIYLNGKDVEEMKGYAQYETLKAKMDLWMKAV